MATLGGGGPVGGRGVQIAVLGALAVVLLWVTTPPGTLGFLLRSPIILARDLIARFRPAVAPAAVVRKPIGSPFVYLEPSNWSSGQTTTLPVSVTGTGGAVQQNTPSQVGAPVSPPGSPAPLPEAPVPLPESPVPLPESPVPLPESPVPLPESPVPLPESPVPLPESPVPLPEAPDLPEPSDLPEVPDLPGPGDVPDVPGLPGLPDLPLPGG